MSDLIRKLAQKTAPALIKTRWVYTSLTGTEAERIQAEYRMGCYLTYLHTRDAKLDHNPDTLNWLRALSDHLALTLVNRDRKFQVRCSLGPEANAFALPGGFLFISRALLELCEFDRDEIAFVIAHEMGHVLRSHSLNRLLASKIAHLLSRGTVVAGALKPLLTDLIHRIVTQGYSRQQEFEADRVAVRMMRVAGYEPAAALRLFQRLQQQATEPGPVGAWFSSHPPLPLRIERVRRAIEGKQDR